jgi:hypothetical protein
MLPTLLHERPDDDRNVNANSGFVRARLRRRKTVEVDATARLDIVSLRGTPTLRRVETRCGAHVRFAGLIGQKAYSIEGLIEVRDEELENVVSSSL